MRGSLKLRGARVALDASAAIAADVEIEHGRIRRISPGDGGVHPGRCDDGPGVEVDLHGYLILPGLINAHDHLEFNLYPRLGRGPYANAGAWARDIYHPGQPALRAQ